LHLFTQQCWLESWGLVPLRISREAQSLRHLKITLRHSDWWSWESSAPLLLDAKQRGTASETKHSTATDKFDARSWGYQFHYFQDLKVLELELETVEGKRDELDAIVSRAADWQFPLGNGKILALNAGKTRKTGWHGIQLRKRTEFLTVYLSSPHKDADEYRSVRPPCVQ